MAHIGPAVRARRERIGWTIQRLAALAGYDPSYISRLERGEVGYTPETEEKLAWELNTSVAAFHLRALNELAAPETEHPTHRAIPVIPYERALAVIATGNPRFTAEEMKDAVTTELTVSPATFALRIRDDMMHPSFRLGDIILIDPGEPPRPADYVVAKDGRGEVVFNRYRVAGTGNEGKLIIEIIPENPYYPSWRSDEHEIEVIGVMVEHRSPRRRLAG